MNGSVLEFLIRNYADGGPVRMADGGRTYNPYTGRFESYGEGSEHSFFNSLTSTAPATDPVFRDDVLGGGPTQTDKVTSVDPLSLPGLDLVDNGGAPGQGVGVPGPSTPGDPTTASIAGLAGLAALGLAPSPVGVVGTLGGLANALGTGALSKGVSVNGLSTNNVANDVEAALAVQADVPPGIPTSVLGVVSQALGLGNSGVAPDTGSGLAAAASGAANMGNPGSLGGPAAEGGPSAAGTTAGESGGSEYERGGYVIPKSMAGGLSTFRRAGSSGGLRQLRTRAPSSSLRTTVVNTAYPSGPRRSIA